VAAAAEHVFTYSIKAIRRRCRWSWSGHELCWRLQYRPARLLPEIRTPHDSQCLSQWRVQRGQGTAATPKFLTEFLAISESRKMRLVFVTNRQAFRPIYKCELADKLMNPNKICGYALANI